MDVMQVLDFYERLTGRRLIRDNQVIGQINIVINQPVPKDEAIKIIEINLLMNGFSLVPVDRTDGKLWKVIGTGEPQLLSIRDAARRIGDSVPVIINA